MSGQQNNRFSIMNFGERLLGQDERQFQMSNAWVPITPEKLILIGYNPISDYPMNQMMRANFQEFSQMRRANFQEFNQMRIANVQEFPVPGSDYMKEMMLPCNRPDPNLHLIGGQMSQTAEHNNFYVNSDNGNRVLNPIIASSYPQSWHCESSGLNSNTLELLLRNNATNVASANRNLNLSVNMAARNPLLPKHHPQAVNNVRESNAGVHGCNIHSTSDIVNNDANKLLIQNRNVDLNGSNSNSFLNSGIHCSVSNQLMGMFSDGSNSNSLLNSDIHCSVSNQLMGIFSETPQGDPYAKYNLNYMPPSEADVTINLTNSLPSIPETVDQFKFVDNLLSTLPDYTIAESTTQEKDKQEVLASSRENEIQEYCDGLLQQIVDSSSAAISTCGDQKGYDSSICDKGSDLGFDLNKTPEQRAPKRRKHRPKVIVESKSKRSPNAATPKTQVKENRAKKRKNIPKTAGAPQADVIKETFDSTVAARKSCRKTLNFDLENTGYESQSRTICHQDLRQRNEKDFNTTSDYKTTEVFNGANTSSALLISQQDELALKNQQTRNMDDINVLLNQILNGAVSSERNPPLALSATTEEQQIAKFPETEKGPAHRNSERNKECIQQSIQAKEIDNITFRSETCFKNSEKTTKLICQDILQMVPNTPSKSIKGKRSKRKHCSSIEIQHDPATNGVGTSLCQEILQVDENFKGATQAKGKGSLKTQRRKRSQNGLHAKVQRSSRQTMSKDDSEKLRIRDKNGSQSQPREMSNCCNESNRAVEQHNISTIDLFAISGESHQINSTLIDEIICQLNGLNISVMEGQKALVPYKGDGSVVPYQESELVKKHKPRPKVDLDPETERTWKLLMGKEGSEDPEGNDKEKEKWWEEERNVFRGRADSFIARMHLVQGDRRFSKWKGSVVDSVIGVFLTQNVSDHLSSSAFMSLAARFPLMSNNSKGPYDVCTYKSVEEPEVCILNPDETIISYGGRTFSQPIYHLGFGTPHLTTELWRDSEALSMKGSLTKPYNRSSDEEFLSSQDSLDSSITQGTRGVRSCSASNSESEGPNSGYEPSITHFLTSTNSLQVGKTTMFQEFYNSVNGVSLLEERNIDGQVQQTEHVKQSSIVSRNNNHNFQSALNHPSNFCYPQEQAPDVPSNDYGLHYSETQGLETSQIYGDESFWPNNVSIDSKFHDTRYGRFGIKEVGTGLDKPTEKQNGNGSSQNRSHTNYSQPSSTHHFVNQKILQPECRSHTESLNTSQIFSRGQDDVVNDCCTVPEHVESEKGLVCSENSSVEPKSQKKVYSPDPSNESKLKVSKSRKMKPEAEKKPSENWDTLRKEVQARGTTIERSKDTMDSLDYEAVRCAPVKEISDTIKERGMNNMLAERIKEFLNRLVNEHGSIDLEWLRYVPPDKVKDYLLSIRGLGLKSVECVRLLTLHHLAFPVDTNVGRIAVRLGWVPLQPLPESLQLHLLELYPILESIQKYLWPRLCKLDQRTLYELHYQMITFGKVFCTKSKPNCNACPMRAECRHFASAFASARLALPGPEEKGIMSMPVPIASERNPSISMNPRILHLPQNLIKESSPENWKCEPIIEEPETPEQEWTQAIESDIEDFFEEDPDEIPTIELNKEEFAINVQNFLQEYKEHQEGDMSKALVALNPQYASIPTPKLKNVSRLRTEHQVYELPDSHPLLEKMDIREPDDPSPYLLAIWTPGETANSIEPPERKCGSQDSTSLCNDETCFACNSTREANSQTVRGTLLIPCRTATRGSFPLNGTYFQVNELFADHASSIQPIDIPRAWIWNLPRRTVYFGTSVTSIFKGLTTQEIQHCFWRGFVCVRGFDQQKRAPRPLLARLHFPASRLAKTKK